MSYTVSFGVMTKRVNSTKQGYTEVLSASCLLKPVQLSTKPGSTNQLNPTFSIQAQIAADALLSCNYMYVAAFGRYYWITDIEFLLGVWYVTGETDVLATFKSAIGDTTTYILRSASEYDERIADGFYVLENVAACLPTWEPTGFDTNGTVIATVLGNDGSDNMCYYAMTPGVWASLYSVLYTSSFLNNIGSFWQNIATDIYNTVINPGDYISSAIWLPISYADINVSESGIVIAQMTTAFQGKKISPSTLLLYNSKFLALPDHPQELTNGVWMRGNRCSRDTLLLPGYGMITLDSDIIAGMAIRGVTIQYAVDCSGALTYHVNYGSKDVYCNADIATPCGFADTRPDFSQALSSTLGAAGAFATGSASGVMAGFKGLLDASLSFAPSVERISSGGSRTLPTVEPYFLANSVFYLLPPDAYNTAGSGRPLGKTRQISTLSGYMVCADTVSVECTGATRSEIEQINNYLTGGFYYE